MNREQIAARLYGLDDYISSKRFNKVLDEIEAIVREAVKAEREACAVLIEPKNDKSDWTEYAHQCAILARLIRFRGEETA
jgi:hypothetical protein